MGHVRKMEVERIPNKMEELAIRKKRPIGRTRKSWVEGDKRDVEKRVIERQADRGEEIWRDRRKWRGLVNFHTQL